MAVVQVGGQLHLGLPPDLVKLVLLVKDEFFVQGVNFQPVVHAKHTVQHLQLKTYYLHVHFHSDKVLGGKNQTLQMSKPKNNFNFPFFNDLISKLTQIAFFTSWSKIPFSTRCLGSTLYENVAKMLQALKTSRALVFF